MANFFDQFDTAAQVAPAPSAVAGVPADSGSPAGTPSNFFDQFDAPAAQPQQPSFMESALKPITSYPDVYQQMRGEAVQQMGQGVGQVQQPDYLEKAKGVGNLALGGIGYVASPINAAYRTLVGQPVQDITGIPKEYTEAAAQLATPGLGLTRLPANVLSGVGAATKAAVPTVAELKTAAQAGYKSPELASVELKPETLPTLANTTIADLNKAGFDENLAPKTFGILSKMTKAPEGAVVTVNNLESVRRMLGKAAGSIDPTEKAAAMSAKAGLDSFVENIPQSSVIQGPAEDVSNVLTEARGNYAAAKLGEALDTRIAKAESRAARSNSGLNLENNLRTQVDQFLESPKSGALSDTERSALKDFVAGTATQNTLRYVGNLLGGGGGLGTIASGAAGEALLHGVFPGAGVAFPIMGASLRMVSNALTSRQASQLSDLLRSRSPLAKQMQASLDSFNKYASAAQSAPATPRMVAMLTIQSRNLANNLKDAGITISPDDIMRSLTGSVPGRAEDQQQ